MYPPLAEHWRLYCPTCKAIRGRDEWQLLAPTVPIVRCVICHGERTIPEGYRDAL